VTRKGPNRLSQRLAGYGCGLGAVAASLCLPEKADGAVVWNGGIDVTSLAESEILNLQFVGGTQIVGQTSGCWGPGFNFEQDIICGGDEIEFDFFGNTCGGASYYILRDLGATGAMRWTAPDSSFDLASIDTNSYAWAPYIWYGTYVPDSGPVLVGLRMVDGSDSYYGWAELERGSLTINEAAFNNVAGDSFYPGQIPEPGSLVLLLAGAAGVSALRRRRAT